MINQIKKANLLNSLHVKDNPLILFNIWDAGSALAIQEAGAQVIATGSWSVAASHGYNDGENISFDLVLANLKRIIASVNLPVTIDLEGGYGKHADEVRETVRKVIEAGAVGINLEDQIIGGKNLYSIEEQCLRIKAAREAAEHASIPIFINARTDIFFKINSINHNDSDVEEALHRARAYSESGANGFFVPGLEKIQHIEKLCRLSPIHINVMVSSSSPTSKQLTESGVTRISYGPHPYYLAINALKKSAGIALSKKN